MSFRSVGDQSQFFLSRNHSARLKSDLLRLTQELSTGKLAKPATPAAGDVAQLMGIGRSLTTLASYRTATAEADVFARVTQDALGVIHDIGNGLGAALGTASSSNTAGMLRAAGTDAVERFGAAVRALNVQVGGRSVFAGTATDTPPLADPAAMLASISAAIAGEATATGIAAAVDAWFDAPGGGYATMGYAGSGAAPSFRVAEGEHVSTGITAGDQGIRDMLKGFALGALIADPALSGNVAEQAALAGLAAGRILTGTDRITEIRADLGATQARLETRATRQAAEKSALELAEARFTVADPYDTATAYAQLETQLDSLYAMTARLQQLSLVEYLR